VKHSFTLFETILALTVISILIGGFLRTSINSPTISFHSIKNTLLLEETSKLSTLNFGVDYTHKSTLVIKLTEEGPYKKLLYSKGNIFFEKHTIPLNETQLSNKVFP